MDKPAQEIIDDDALARRILVIVPARNEAATIEACLGSLLSGAPGDANLALVVVDGASEDATAARVAAFAGRHPGVSLLPNPARRQGAGINLAARTVEPQRDIIVRADAHALYPPGYVLGVARALLAREVDSLAVVMDTEAPPGAGRFARAVAAVIDTPLGAGGSAHRGGHRSGFVDHGHHAGFRRARFLALGGYDETLIANEDAEYDTRLRAAGGRIWLEADLRHVYFPRATAGALWRQYWAYGRGRVQHLRRHRARPRLRQLAPPLHVLCLLISLVAAMSPGAQILTAYAVMYLSVIALVASGLGLQRGAWIGAAGGLALLIIHQGFGLGAWRELLLGRPQR